MAHMTKSKMRISMIGRVPASAAPSPAPMMVASEIGVETTRCGPNSSRKPLYWPHSPPRATSSPSAQTVGSRRISCSAASRPASIRVTLRVPELTVMRASGCGHVAPP
jgi:hypothetical protein